MSYCVFCDEDLVWPVILRLSDVTDHDDRLSPVGSLSFPGENQDQMKIVLDDGGEYDLSSNELFYATREFFSHRTAHARTFFAEAEREARGLLNDAGKAPLYYCKDSKKFHDETVSTFPWVYHGECPICGVCHRPRYVGSYKTELTTDGKVTVTFWDNNPYENQAFQVPLYGPLGNLPDAVDIWFWRENIYPEKLQEFLQEVFEISPEIELS